eukprot:COSAG01_NODE_4471_length_4996_cov_2.220339_4_plen_176_part_00
MDTMIGNRTELRFIARHAQADSRDRAKQSFRELARCLSLLGRARIVSDDTGILLVLAVAVGCSRCCAPRSPSISGSRRPRPGSHRSRIQASELCSLSTADRLGRQPVCLPACQPVGLLPASDSPTGIFSCLLWRFSRILQTTNLWFGVEPAPAVAAAADFCGGLLNRLTGSRWVL